MLRLKLNIRDIGFKPIKLDNPLLEWDENHEYIKITTASPHFIENNDYVTFRRNNGSREYSERRNVRVIDDYSFYVEPFERIMMHPYDGELTYLESYPYSEGTNLFLRIGFGEDEHIFSQNRENINVKEYLHHRDFDVSNYFKGSNHTKEYLYPDAITNRCGGEGYVVYEDMFIYSTDDVTDLNPDDDYHIPMYEFSEDDIANSRGDVRITYFGDTIYDNLGFLVPFVTSMDDSKNLLLPVRTDEDSIIANYILTNFNEIALSCDDTRFIYEDTEGLHLKNDATIERENKKMSAEIALENSNAYDIFNDTINEGLLKEEEKKNSKSPIIDYEKKTFTPIFKDENGEEKNVNRVLFNLHFRERRVQKVTVKDSEYEFDDGEWAANDDCLWNNYTLKNWGMGAEEHLIPKTEGLKVDDADLIGHLGMTDEDVYYRKKRLKQSFIRLSFFDTPHRSNQRLLFYSTIFTNVNSLYDKYITLVSSRMPSLSGFTFDEPKEKDLRLSATFSASDKYDNIDSSEGFYLYLFPDIVEGGEISTIYMKVEYNNAKYGVTVPFVMPLDEDGNIINPTDEQFPYNYTREDDGNISVNMARVFKDMYIPIKVKYDINNSRYVWFSDFPTENTNIVFNLYEPRVNRSKEKEKCKG